MYNNKKYDYIIPIGSNCRIGEALRDHDKRKISIPTDWTFNSLRTIYELYDNEFNDFFNEKTCSVENYFLIRNQHGDYKYIMNHKYQLNFAHETMFTKKIEDKYKRRIERLLSILNSNNNILFVRNLMDGYMPDELHGFYVKESEKIGYSSYDLTFFDKFQKLFMLKYPKINSDILIIHYNEIDLNLINNKNIYTVKSVSPQNNFSWDRLACGEVIKNITIIND